MFHAIFAEENDTMTKPTWTMPPIERRVLANWLENYEGSMILLTDALIHAAGLNASGVKWDAGTRRLKYGERSVALTVHPRIYFAELVKHGHGHVAGGVWWGVWMLDVAAALLALAGVEHDPTAMLTPRSLRYKTICMLLRGDGEARDAEEVVGEIRG